MGEFYHNWITNAVTNLIFKRLNEQREAPRYRWNALLSPEPTQTVAVASPAEQHARTIEPTQANSANPNSEAKAATVDESQGNNTQDRQEFCSSQNNLVFVFDQTSDFQAERVSQPRRAPAGQKPDGNEAGNPGDQ